MSRTWSVWTPIELTSRYRGPAVYQVRACDGTQPVPIERLLARDIRGLLCIGMTTNMERRRRNFRRGLKVGRGHSEANLLFYIQKLRRFGRRFPGRLYQYRYRPVTDQLEARDLEERLIRRYIRRFGEVPPLNSAIPNRYEKATAPWRARPRGSAKAGR